MSQQACHNNYCCGNREALDDGVIRDVCRIIARRMDDASY